MLGDGCFARAKITTILQRNQAVGDVDKQFLPYEYSYSTAKPPSLGSVAIWFPHPLWLRPCLARPCASRPAAPPLPVASSRRRRTPTAIRIYRTNEPTTEHQCCQMDGKKQLRPTSWSCMGGAHRRVQMCHAGPYIAQQLGKKTALRMTRIARRKPNQLQRALTLTLVVYSDTTLHLGIRSSSRCCTVPPRTTIRASELTSLRCLTS